ncbi:MAG: DinB family protein [Acidimicrobiia bacterium]
MTYYGAREIADSFRTVRLNTIMLAEEIPENRYSFRAAPETRSVAEMLSHLAITPRFQHQIHGVERRTSFEGYDFPKVFSEATTEEKRPKSKAEILEALQTEGEKFASWVETLSEEVLAEQFRMPPGATPATKTRFEMLLSVKEHEMHHRGQLMLIQRMLGIVPHLTRRMQERIAEIAQSSGSTRRSPVSS